MALAIIDGREYVPHIDISAINDTMIQNCIADLVSIQYFNEERKNRAVAWNALNHLSPSLAELVAQNENAAYELINGHEDFDYDDIDMSNNGKPNYTPVVTIGSIKYIPKENSSLDTYPESIVRCLKELVSLQYFNIKHKNRAVAWDALNALHPEMAELCAKDVSKAYKITHGE
jgi:hypothetical protein